MANFIYCKDGCGRPAREEGQKQDCPDCNKDLCEWCCDAKKAAAKGKP